MELTKKKYKKEEVSELLNSNTYDYENKIAELKDRINALIEDNKTLIEKLDYYKNKECVIVDTLEQVNKDSQLKEVEIDLSYQLVIDSLKKFSIKWVDYFSALKEKYPLYPVVKEAVDLKEKLTEILKTDDKKKIISTLNESLDATNSDVSKSNIQEFIESTSEDGFNIDEVLHPGELKLEDLCKELGLIENKK